MIRRTITCTALAVGLGACAGFEAAACGGPEDPGAGQKVELPGRVAGLGVALEDDATNRLNSETEPEATYQCPGEAVVYALRDGEELRGVLQISRLAPDARMDDREFLSNLVRGISGSVGEPIEVNGIDVYKAASAGNETFTTTWFQGPFMFFLTVREDDLVPDTAAGVNVDAVLREVVGVPIVTA